MAKTKSVYFCNNCGAESPKWIGRCPVCGEWNTYVEEVVSTKSAAGGRGEFGTMEQSKVRPQRIDDIQITEESRIDLGNGELNRVLGGGLVRGSLVLIGGEPGIGKSTLILQTVLALKGQKILYVSGEESARQLKLRAERIGGNAPDCYIVCETSLEDIFVHIRNVDPDIVVIDSIQTIATSAMESSPGSVGQVRECAASLLKFAKQTNTPVLLVGHINKEGSIAGPKVLEHIVDTVLQFEGDRHYLYRILRSIKNRFGSTSELGIYEMRQNGLREVSNPSEMLLTQNHEGEQCCHCCHDRGYTPFPYRDTGVSQYGSLRYAATVGDRIRPAANEYVTCRFGKEGRVQIGTKRRFSQYCRRHKS